MTDEIKLSPCAMCGSQDTSIWTRWENSTPLYHYAQCNDCHMTGYNTTDTFTIKDVVKEWDSKWEKEERDFLIQMREELIYGVSLYRWGELSCCDCKWYCKNCRIKEYCGNNEKMLEKLDEILGKNGEQENLMIKYKNSADGSAGLTPIPDNQETPESSLIQEIPVKTYMQRLFCNSCGKEMNCVGTVMEPYEGSNYEYKCKNCNKTIITAKRYPALIHKEDTRTLTGGLGLLD